MDPLNSLMVIVVVYFSSRISTMVWYSLGKFDSMRVIISDSSTFTSNFRRSPLSSSISVIHYLGFIVTSSSQHLGNLLHIIVL